eukprot:TRINITY_DN7668_c0_g1_i2.p1 TRINITY_DN7668_c0_g1~~TRINITY_DN7668_c0_g1_i2.p1  ORF type:complete len:424 (-),score=105.98 TRINITY_DN7668_c0_g1_i2:15-1286(-)
MDDYDYDYEDTYNNGDGNDSFAVPPPPPAPSFPSGGPKWEFEEEKDKWVEFDRVNQRILEGAAMAARSSAPIFSNSQTLGPCDIDFATMTMTEKKTSTKYAVRRVGGPSLPKLKSMPSTQTTTTTATATTKKEDKGFSESKEKMKKCSKLTNWEEFDRRKYKLKMQEKLEQKKEKNKKKKSSKKGKEKDSLESTDPSQKEEDESCSVCLCGLFEDGNDAVVKLSKCKIGHFFHKECITGCYNQENDFLRCPICGTIYGVRKGSQPKGTMTVHRSPGTHVPGYGDVGLITINYDFPSGTQGKEHPNPGSYYEGTSRTAYLPDNAEGNKVLQLLQIAFDRRLTFRIGRSVTTGVDNCVIWNGVHHKTSLEGGPASFGYPDETYFLRVTEELADLGVTLPSSILSVQTPSSLSSFSSFFSGKKKKT